MPVCFRCHKYVFRVRLLSCQETVNVSISINDDDMTGPELISRLRHRTKLPLVAAFDDLSGLKPVILRSWSSEIVFTVYGRCDKNHYGSGCKHFCRPSFSGETGFYACDRLTGEKHCLNGWTGDGCRQRDLCVLANPCHGSAICTMVGSTAHCKCPESLTGELLPLIDWPLELRFMFTRF